jgi:hypothetical protein
MIYFVTSLSYVRYIYPLLSLFNLSPDVLVHA